jgi:hypothetical protein
VRDTPRFSGLVYGRSWWLDAAGVSGDGECFVYADSGDGLALFSAKAVVVCFCLDFVHFLSFHSVSLQ